MFRRNIMVVVILILLLCGVIIGCAEQVTKQPTAPVSIPQTTGPQSGGILKICQRADANTLGLPLLMNTIDEQFQRSLSLETLLRMDANGKSIPFLADTYKPDAVAKTYTITLKKGIKFHDDTDFNAKACKWNLDQWKTSPNWPVASVDIIDDYTIRLNLTAWDNTIETKLATTNGLMISPTSYEKNGKDWAINNPVGTGPFKLVNWQRSVKQTYQKFANYWQKGKPYLDVVEVIIIADPLVQLASFINGEVDVLCNVDPKDVKSLQAKGNYIVSMPTVGGSLYSIMYDSGNPKSPFADLRVRQATGYALDKKAIRDAIFLGLAVPTDQFGSIANWSYNPAVTGFPYNPNKAKELLSQAGYPNGFKTKLITRSDRTIVDMNTAVLGFLNAVGINASLEVNEVAKYSELYMMTGWSDGMLSSMLSAAPDISARFSNFLTNATTGYGKVAMHNDELDKAIREATGAPDFDTKKAKLLQLQSIFFDKYAMFTPMLVQGAIAVKYPKMHGDGISDPIDGVWAPENAWLEKK